MSDDAPDPFTRGAWRSYRWNPELRRWEGWHTYWGWWQVAQRYDALTALLRGASRLRYADTWAEPFESMLSA